MERARSEYLKAIGRSIDAPADVRALVDEAFANYHTSCLWSIRKPEKTTVATAMVVAGYLKRNGNRATSLLADKIESASDAAFISSSANH